MSWRVRRLIQRFCLVVFNGSLNIKYVVKFSVCFVGVRSCYPAMQSAGCQLCSLGGTFHSTVGLLQSCVYWMKEGLVSCPHVGLFFVVAAAVAWKSVWFTSCHERLLFG